MSGRQDAPEQALGCNNCAVVEHLASGRPGTSDHVGPKGALESGHERFACHFARPVSHTDAKITDALGPVVLVVVLGNDDLRHARSRSGGRGTRAAVVNDGRDPSEEQLLIDLVDSQTVGPLVCGR